MPELKNNILVVAESIDVEDSSGSKANVALIQNLHKAGYNLKVYHYTRKDIQLPAIPCYAIPENRRSFLFFLSRIERYSRYYLNLKFYKILENSFGFSFTFFNDRNSIIAELNKIKDFVPDLVLTLSKGGSFRPHNALLYIPKFHQKWMAYIHDPYPRHSYPRPYDYVEPGHHQKREFFLKVAEKSRYAAYPSKMLAEWMESYFPLLKGKAVIIPHQINYDFPQTESLPKFFNKNAFTLLHAGSLLGARDPFVLLTAFQNFLKLFPESQENSQLLFIGDTKKYNPLFTKFKNNTPQIFSSNGYLPFATVRLLQESASVNIILEANGSISPFLPGKFPHCIQAEKPIFLLGPYYSESKRLLGENYPYWSEINDLEKITKIISSLYLKWKENPKSLYLDRPDLNYYLSEKHLKYSIDSSLNHRAK